MSENKELVRMDEGGEIDLAFFPTVVGIAERMADLYGENIIHHEQRGWYVWQKTHWKPDVMKLIQMRRFALGTVRQIQKDSESLSSNSPAVKAIQETVKKLCLKAEGNLKSVVANADLVESLAVDGDAMDAAPTLLNCPNGTVELSTGELRGHQREDLLTRVGVTEFDDAAECPRFLEFLGTIFGGDERLIEYVQKVLGYSLLGHTKEQLFWFWYGPSGRNGKSVLATVVRAVIGKDYAATTPPSTFRPKSANNIPSDIARLDGIRFLTCSEPEASQKWSESLLKCLTGEDERVARFLYQNEFAFKPRFKIHIITNYVPVLDPDSDPLWRRIRVIPFNVRIPEDKLDRNLANTLIDTERRGILRWLVEGARKYSQEGLEDAPAVIAATEDFQREVSGASVASDIFRPAVDPSKGNDFIAQYLIREPGASLIKGDVYEMYEAFCALGSVKSVSKKMFGQTMGGQGFERQDVARHRVRDEDNKHQPAWYNVAYRKPDKAIIQEFQERRNMDEFRPEVNEICARTGLTDIAALYLLMWKKELSESLASMVIQVRGVDAEIAHEYTIDELPEEDQKRATEAFQAERKRVEDILGGRKTTAEIEELNKSIAKDRAELEDWLSLGPRAHKHDPPEEVDT